MRNPNEYSLESVASFNAARGREYRETIMSMSMYGHGRLEVENSEIDSYYVVSTEPGSFN
jgi:hypothetical protein